MDSCFVHKDVEAVATCPYCAKRYCADCLLLHGPRQVVICRHCYDVISGRLRSSAGRRRVYAVGGGIVGVIALVWGLLAFLSDPVSSAFYIVAGVASLGAAAVNLARLKQIREFLPTRPYDEGREAGG